jgi:hypothetical protein
MMVLLSVALSSPRRTHLPGMDNRAEARLAGMPQTREADAEVVHLLRAACEQNP